jgi:Fe-S cluster biosynthesis and repair protein YggX
MARTVNCIKYGKQMAGLDIAPIPGEKGQWVYDNISKVAWNEWQQYQTRLINEKHLNLLEVKTREYLLQQMHAFFTGGEVDTVEGYTRGKF